MVHNEDPSRHQRHMETGRPGERLVAPCKRQGVPRVRRTSTIHRAGRQKGDHTWMQHLVRVAAPRVTSLTGMSAAVPEPEPTARDASSRVKQEPRGSNRRSWISIPPPRTCKSKGAPETTENRDGKTTNAGRTCGERYGADVEGGARWSGCAPRSNLRSLEPLTCFGCSAKDKRTTPTSTM